MLQVAQSTSAEQEIADLSMVESNVLSDESAYVTGHVAGLKVQFFIDSGAQVNTITMESFNAILQNDTGRDKLLEQNCGSDKSLRGYASHGNIDVVATFSAELFVSYERPTTIEKFYVIRESRPLLGYNTAVRYSLLAVGLKVPVKENSDPEWRCEFSIYGVQGDSNRAFPKFNIPAVKLSYDRFMPPSKNVYTHIPAAFKELTKQKLDELKETGIIEKVTKDMDKSFCSSLLVIPKGRSDIRLVVDLHGPNRCIYRTPFKMPNFASILLQLHRESK